MTPQPWRVLVFSRTLGYRHDSIAAGLTLIQQLGRDHGFGVDASEDPAVFSDSGLAPYAAVVFLSTTGDVLAAGQQAAFERFIGAGRGYVGVHSAADTEYDWAWYGDLMGAYFQAHPPGLHPARLVVEDRTHDSTSHLDAIWERTDEWYNFRTNPRASVNVLITLDESTYPGGTMGADHPIAWYHNYDGGRAWYTGLGHTAETFAEPAFIQYLLGGIRWASGR
jgi:type 1 glutamine amidotransferase